MSKLSEILGVNEGAHFKYEGYNYLYRVNNGILEYFENSEGRWKLLTGTGVYNMIENPEGIQVTPEVQTALKTLNCLKKQYECNCKKDNNCLKCDYYDGTTLDAITYIQSWIDVINNQENEIKRLQSEIREIMYDE